MASVIIALKKGRNRGQFLKALRDAGFNPVPYDSLKRHLRIDGVSLAQIPQAIKDDPAVEAMDDGDREVSTAADQALAIDESMWSASWPIARIIRRDPPWNPGLVEFPIGTFFRSQRDGTGVDYYHMDSGILVAHDEFGGRASIEYEYVVAAAGGDGNGHGTITASSAVGNTCGVARGATVFSFKVTTNQVNATATVASVTDTASAVLTHYNGRSGLNRPAVANLSYVPSFGGTADSALSDLIDAGIVVCVAAANDGALLDNVNYSTAFVADIVVSGAMGMGDIPAYMQADTTGMSRTNYGSAVSIMSPGQMLRAASISGVSDYMLTRGSTSCASAFTAGVVACMLQGHSRLTGRTQVQAVVAQLLANATTGRFQEAFGLSPLPDRILYLDPDQVAPETISGL